MTIRIGTHGRLNSKSEFRQNQVQGLSVTLIDREKWSADKDAAELNTALKTLSERSNNVNKEFVSLSNLNSVSSLGDPADSDVLADLC